MGAGVIQSLGRDGCDVVPPPEKNYAALQPRNGGRNATTLDKPTVADIEKSGSGTTNQQETECSEYGQRHAAPDTPPKIYKIWYDTPDGWMDWWMQKSLRNGGSAT